MRATCFSSLLAFVLFASFLSAAEFRPVSVWTDAETYPNPPGCYAIGKMFDGDPGTYACILDQTQPGPDGKVDRSAPVTSSFVMDLGEVKRIRGVRLMARNDWGLTMARVASVFICSDAQGKDGVRWLAEKQPMPLINYSNSDFITWPEPVETRFVGIRIDDSNQRDIPFLWRDLQFEWFRRVGLSVTGDGTNRNVQIAEIACFDELPADFPAKNPPEMAFPMERLHRDWLYQDLGMNVAPCFHSPTENTCEKAMTEKVRAEILARIESSAGSSAGSATGSASEALAKEMTVEKELEAVPGCDPRWKAHYFRLCEIRRQLRLQELRKRADRFIYVKHFVFGSTNGLVGKYDIPDEQVRDYTDSFKPGSQLCVATLREDGSVTNEVLLEKPNGVICYPTLSYDAKTLVFSMRDDFEKDSYYLYVMDLATRKVTQITFPLKDPETGKDLPVADCEPAWLPDGRIVFASTRGVQISDCWYRAKGDIYVCGADGSNIRRLTYDQLMTNLPQVLEDGRIVFTRWEYCDRSALYTHPLISMNPDGTVQTEYYGNNSMFPSSIIHANRIPGSSKIIATISGHHTIYRGKLGIINRAEGTQAGQGITFVNTKLDGSLGSEPANVVPRHKNDMMIDIFGQFGPQYAHPFAFDETHFLASFAPEGSPRTFGPLNPPFGAYFMTADGARELLAFDPWQGTGRIVPIMEQTVPPDRGSHVNADDSFGTFYLQNVYFGPGLEGVKPGTAKKLRIIALEYRPCRMGYGQNGGECETGLCQTPISLNSGSWDVKHDLGEVTIEEDGSCYFQVPARVPVYFQILDEKGFTIQSMRSWSTLMNGEQFACLGCHENKNDALPPSQRKPTLAMRHPVQVPRRADGSLHPLVAKYQQESWLASVENYLALNVSRRLDANAPVDGFSYVQQIQPILDRHCVRCHDGQNEKTTLCLTGETAKPETIKLIGAGSVDPKRAYTRSYVELTTSGNPDSNPWMTWLKPRSRAVMLPPYFTGSSQSRIMGFFEPTHYDVKVSEVEKRTFACWLDLLIPFCGSYPEANTWTDSEKAEFDYFQKKRKIYAELEWQNWKKSAD